MYNGATHCKMFFILYGYSISLNMYVWLSCEASFLDNSDIQFVCDVNFTIYMVSVCGNNKGSGETARMCRLV